VSHTSRRDPIRAANDDPDPNGARSNGNPITAAIVGLWMTQRQASAQKPRHDSDPQREQRYACADQTEKNVGATRCYTVSAF
jgi:hypothetical protein